MLKVALTIDKIQNIKCKLDNRDYKLFILK